MTTYKFDIQKPDEGYKYHSSPTTNLHQIVYIFIPQAFPVCYIQNYLWKRNMFVQKLLDDACLVISLLNCNLQT